jgi:hypothetical protein
MHSYKPPPSPRCLLDTPCAIQPLTIGQSRRPTIERDTNPTCRSALPHEPEPDRDSLFKHYLGCIEFHQRQHFLDEGNAFWRRQVEDEFVNIRAAHHVTGDREILAEAKARVKRTIDALAVSIEAQYKRTLVLRRALSQQDRPGSRDTTRAAVQPSVLASPGTRGPELASLVGLVDQSRKAWRASREYATGIQKVREWRKAHQLPVNLSDPRDENTELDEPGRDQVQKIVAALRGLQSVREGILDYDLERDVNAYLIQFTREQSSGSNPSQSQQHGGHGLPDPKKRQLPATPFEESLTDVRFKGKFPDQRISMNLLLRSAHSNAPDYDRDILSNDSCQEDLSRDRNILSKHNCDEKDPTRMRYLHIPANNMEARDPYQPPNRCPTCS